MPTLTETIKLPGTVDPSTVSVSLQLWGEGEPITGTSSNTTIGGPRRIKGNPWTIENVVGNTAIEPAGTVYRVTRTWSGLTDPLVDYIAMPTSGTSYRVDELLTDPPDALPTVTP